MRIKEQEEGNKKFTMDETMRKMIEDVKRLAIKNRPRAGNFSLLRFE